MKLAIGFVVSLLMAGGGALAAPGEQAPQAQVFDETIDVRVVNVEAVVTDGRGNRVRGLTAGDLRLLVDGAEVPIEYFTEIVEGKAVAVEASGTQAPVAAGEEVGRNYLIYIDESFSVASIRNEILEKLERDLALLAPADRMAVLAFDGARIEVLSGWTGDRAILSAALAQARLRPALGNRSIAYQRKLQQDTDWILENADSFEEDQIAAFLNDTSGRISPEARTQLGKTAPAAAGALRGFESPPGRKVMLLLSGAWSLRVAPRLYGPLIQSANQLGFTLYPVDVAQSGAAEVSLLDGFARATGGRVVASTRLKAFREVVADTGTYYWLGFTPSWKADDRGHRTTVEARRPGLEVRARGGFSDLSPQTENAMKAEGVLLFGGAQEEKRLIVELGKPRRSGRGQVEVPVTLGVPVESLALRPTGSGFVAETPVAAAVLDDQGGRADLPASHLKVALDAAPRSGTYARFRMVVRLSDAQQRLVFTVRDPATGSALWGEADFQPRHGR